MRVESLVRFLGAFCRHIHNYFAQLNSTNDLGVETPMNMSR